MTLALLKKEALKLPKSHRLKLAGVLLESVPARRHAPTHEEIERRAYEALSGKIKLIPANESKARIDRLIRRARPAECMQSSGS